MSGPVRPLGAVRYAIRLDHPQRKRPMWDGNNGRREPKKHRALWRSRTSAQSAIACVTYADGWVPTVVEVED